MYLKIKENLFLSNFSLPKSEVTLEEEKTCHYFIFDRSGSMSWTLRELIENLINQALKLPDGDVFSAGWFSSKGEFGWICKGLSVSENREAIPTMLRKYNTTLGLTCYSEILADVPKVVDDLDAISKNHAFTFFSDGYPNQDEGRIISLCKSLAPKLSTAMLVGYGNWYGRELMAEMAKALGGVLVHSSNLADFSKSYASFCSGAENLQPKVEFKVPTGAVRFITTVSENKEVITHSVDDSVIYLSPDTANIFYFTEKEPNTQSNDFDKNTAIYATSRSASQLGDYQLAQDLLGVIGDVRFIDTLNNSFVIGEYGKLESDLLEAVFDKSQRFVNGQKDDYVPAEDAFCGLQLMESLINDPTAELLPKHPAFSYRKISRGSRYKNPDLKLHISPDTGISMNNMVWSKDALNISVSTQVKGIVNLDAEADKLGLSRQFVAESYKSYTLIHDGKWNITELPLRNVSPETEELFNKHNLVVSKSGNVVIINPTVLPVINRKIASAYTDLNKLCGIMDAEIELSSKQKVSKAFYDALPQELKDQTEAFVKPTAFTDEQVEYLAKFGVKRDGTFNPDKEQLPKMDEIPITEIKLEVKGFSSLPSLNAVNDKLADKKKLTPSEQAIYEAMTHYNNATKDKSDKQKAVFLKEEAERIRKELFGLRSHLNRAKFAVVLGKKNFVQKPKLDDGDNPYELKGRTYKVKINRNASVDI
jgi:hypothetical protein